MLSVATKELLDFFSLADKIYSISKSTKYVECIISGNYLKLRTVDGFYLEQVIELDEKDDKKDVAVIVEYVKLLDILKSVKTVTMSITPASVKINAGDLEISLYTKEIKSFVCVFEEQEHIEKINLSQLSTALAKLEDLRDLDKIAQRSKSITIVDNLFNIKYPVLTTSIDCNFPYNIKFENDAPRLIMYMIKGHQEASLSRYKELMKLQVGSMSMIIPIEECTTSDGVAYETCLAADRVGKFTIGEAFLKQLEIVTKTVPNSSAMVSVSNETGLTLVIQREGIKAVLGEVSSGKVLLSREVSTDLLYQGLKGITNLSIEVLVKGGHALCLKTSGMYLVVRSN